ncbi:MAG TPA: phospho-N-acetylmuramoyl-pentapeptide-transferase [Spirochaetia bacterium]|nr:phospho-N-acetylmuramoyl-pentapeptide-transferase [Spirochaetia bacterium]
MILKFLHPLLKELTGLSIFQYITFRAVYAAVFALLISFLLGPWVIRKLKQFRIGQEIREDGPESHFAKSGTPTMGGVLIILAIVLSLLLWQDIDSVYTWLLLVSIVGFGLIGFVDDYLKISRKNAGGLKATFKWIAQTVLAVAIVLIIYYVRPAEYTTSEGLVVDATTLLYLPFLKDPVLDLSFLYIPAAVILILWTTNAVNITDGLDGLATGLMIMVGLTFAVLSYLSGRQDFATYLVIPFVKSGSEITIAGLTLVGACVGFLWFNAHPAQVMMGDTGSLGLGGMVGVLALLLKKEVLLFVIMGVFMLETMSVIIQVLSFKLRGKRVFKMAPLHHHFELKGWDESKVVIRFWILGGLFTLLSLSTLKIQ